jgi:hypothetical protein
VNGENPGSGDRRGPGYRGLSVRLAHLDNRRPIARAGCDWAFSSPFSAPAARMRDPDLPGPPEAKAHTEVTGSRPPLTMSAAWKVAGLAERACSFSFNRKTKSPLTLGVVLAAWDTAGTAASVKLLEDHLGRLPGVDLSMVAVANNGEVLADLRRGPRGPRGPRGSFDVIAGSNAEAEFSAYEEGRAHIVEGYGAGADGPGPGVWVLVNDRLPAYDTGYLSALTPDLLRFVGSSAVASGRFDSRPRPVGLLGHELYWWIRSNFVLVSSEAMKRIGSPRSLGLAEYEVHVPSAFPGSSWPLSTWPGGDAGELLRVWLTRPGGWSKAGPLDEQSWPRLRLKAMAVLNEWLLTARLFENGTAVVPWRQLRVMSHVNPGLPFGGHLLQMYQGSPRFGLGVDLTSTGRVQLAAAVLASRAGAPGTAEKLLSTAGRSAAAAYGASGRAGPALEGAGP